MTVVVTPVPPPTVTLVQTAPLTLSTGADGKSYLRTDQGFVDLANGIHIGQANGTVANQTATVHGTVSVTE